MPLAAGDQLGPYEVTSLLGTGGMGEVYLARDTRLNRNVAIKVLRGGLDAGAEARFQREAEVVASLNHPNVVALYEIGKQGGIEYTVSELVEGESLRHRIATVGALPIRQCVDIAAQIADGLAAAHAAGIVHRDLKPENVMLTRDGRVKILDFGLARQTTVAAFGAVSSGDMETIVSPLTQSDFRTHAGVVLGTASYMSPEQARGEEADYRSDQFSLGLVLYEMLTGIQPFARPSAVETMAAIVREEPPPLPEGLRIPAPLLWILERLLEKDRNQRFDSTRDLYQQLRAIDTHWSSANSSSSLAPAAAVKTKSKLLPPGWLVFVALAVGLVLGCAGMWLLHPAGINIADYRYTPFAMNVSSDGYFSRDGRAVLYSARLKETSQVFLIENGGMPRQLTSTERPSSPIGFDEDDAHVLFLNEPSSADKIGVFRVSRVGGAPQHILDLPGNYFAVALAPDGKSLVVLAPLNSGVYGLLYSSPVGSPWQTYAPAEFKQKLTDVYNSPQLAFSPDSRQLLFVVDASNFKELAWLIAWPLQAGSEPAAVEARLPRTGFTPEIGWMPDNKRIVFSSSSDVSQTANIYIGKVGGPYTQITSSTHGYESPRISPDGKTMLFVMADSDLNIIGVSVADGAPQDIVSTARDESMPAWSTGSDLMAYVTDRDGRPEIWVHRSDGSERRVLGMSDMATPTIFFMTPVPSPDGNRVVFVAAGEGTQPKLWIVPTTGGSPVRATNTRPDVAEVAPFWSPDGSQIAYVAVTHGQHGLSVMTSDGTATPRQIYAGDPNQRPGMPTWLPVGNRIVSSDAQTLFTVSASGGDKQVLATRIDVRSVAATKDGSMLYGVRLDGSVPVLFSLDMKTKALQDIKRMTRAERPASNLNPGTLVTLTPDGKLLTFATKTSRDSLWKLSGFSQ